MSQSPHWERLLCSIKAIPVHRQKMGGEQVVYIPKDAVMDAIQRMVMESTIPDGTPCIVIDSMSQFEDQMRRLEKERITNTPDLTTARSMYQRICQAMKSKKGGQGEKGT